MGLKFRLRGLAETFIDTITCPGCGDTGTDEEHFQTENTRVTFEGIIIVVQCRSCGEVFVPREQRLGVINPEKLRKAVIQDSYDTGEPLYANFEAVRLSAEKLNASRKGDLH